MVDKIEEFGLKILEKIHLKTLADWYREHKEGMRYLIFGALATAVNIISYAIFASLILRFLSDAVRVNASEIIAFIISLIFAYFTNKLYVFESKTNSMKELLREMFSFAGCRIFTEVVSIVIMNMAIWFNINDIIMKIVANIIVIILNFVLSKLIIFKKKGE